MEVYLFVRLACRKATRFVVMFSAFVGKAPFLTPKNNPGLVSSLITRFLVLVDPVVAV
jgi:hypothetical protein